MKVVVMGGTGNISRSIVNLLMEKGHDVTCYNRGLSGEPPEGARHIKGDRRDRDAFIKTMRKEKFDAAINMICYTPEEAADSVSAFRGVQHFIQCSTVCTYGVDYNWMPVSEDHLLAPVTDYGKNKAAADGVFLGAYHKEGFPVTIVRPSTTYGPKRGMLRQINEEFSWIDRIRKGKPILVCGDGKAIHQFMHVDDAAKGFAGILGKQRCIGQVYNLVNRGYMTWEQHHRTAMKVLGREVELVGVPLNTLLSINAERFSICSEIFAHNCYYSSEKIFRDVPEFTPSITLETGMNQVFEHMERNRMITDCDNDIWEDRIIEAQRRVGREC